MVCSNPCFTCNSDGSCASCATPYFFRTATSSCVLCDDPRCSECTNAANTSCTKCVTGWILNSTTETCVSCVTGCTDCATTSTCNTCQTNYYTKATNNNTCVLCSSDLRCKTCTYNANDTITCNSCSDGYWLDMTTGMCMACQAFCKTCVNSTWCTYPFAPYGVTLAETMVGVNTLAACDPGCLNCSTSNPQMCRLCFPGFYQVITADASYCKPCSGICASCDESAPATCFSCWADSYLNTTDNLCYPCEFPCSSCITSGSCTSCVQGYVFITTTSQCFIESSVNNSLANCANQEATSTNPSSTTCSLCLQGYAPTPGGCVPCPQGCLVCNPADLIACTLCMPGFTLNSNSVCVTDSLCPAGCISCIGSVGCVACATNWYLNQNFQCQLNCINPCATCQPTNPFSCITCALGYTLSGTTCVADTSCNTNGNCVTCPQSQMLTRNMTNVNIINQTCSACASTSCWRCMTANTSLCISCLFGSYLNTTDNTCVACPDNCLVCSNAHNCFFCKPGFVDTQVGTIEGDAPIGPQNCISCSSNCLTCEGNPNTCTSCNSGFTLNSGACVSNFNFVVTLTFDVTLAVFEQNFFNVINTIANAAGVGFDQIVVLSITQGSVILRTAVTSTSAAGSNAAINTENAIKAAVADGTSFNGMTVASSSVTTEGGSNEEDSGLSTTAIILLAVLIPVGVICNS